MAPNKRRGSCVQTIRSRSRGRSSRGVTRGQRNADSDLTQILVGGPVRAVKRGGRRGRGWGRPRKRVNAAATNLPLLSPTPDGDTMSVDGACCDEDMELGLSFDESQKGTDSVPPSIATGNSQENIENSIIHNRFDVTKIEHITGKEKNVISEKKSAFEENGDKIQNKGIFDEKDNNKQNLNVEQKEETRNQSVKVEKENKENLLSNVEEYKHRIQNESNVEGTSVKNEEDIDTDYLLSVVGSLPELSGELRAHLRGAVRARRPLADMVRAIARKQYPFTKWFPVINGNNTETGAKDISITKTNQEPNNNGKEENPNDKTKEQNNKMNESEEAQKQRPSWDVAGPSHLSAAAFPDSVDLTFDDDSANDMQLDFESLSSCSSRVPTPVEVDEDLDSILPPIHMVKKESPYSSSVARSDSSCRARGGVSKRGARKRGVRGGNSGSEDELDTYLTLMRDLECASEPPLPELDMPKLAGKIKVSNPGEDDEELGVAETYADYVPAKLNFGCRHPDPVVETSSLSSVDTADVTYSLSLPEETIRSGVLSALQLEAVVYASQAHDHVLPDGTRAGFLIGDGAGVGKGRTIAGIIFENYLQGRKRAVWVSVSNDLKYDAERDLRDIGAPFIPVHQLNKMSYTPITATEGVVFSTYSSLIGHTAAAGATFKRRLDQLVAWCGDDFDGCIVFDECHRAKNLCPGSGTNATETGKAVLKLQLKLEGARLVYASATGASEPRNMAYMVRLGIWGAGSPFPVFRDFLTAVEKRGVGAMEIVAMDMKLRGMYIARQLSFHGVTFKIEEVPLSQQFRETYDKAVALWVEAKKAFECAVEMVGASRKWRRVMWAQFWGAHQRFFKYLCIAAKVERTVQCTRQAVDGGKCVVIGLQSTGEARTLDQLERGKGHLTEFICTAKGVFVSLVEKQFPCPNNMVEDEDYECGRPSSLATDTTNCMCDKLLRDIAAVGAQLPPNTLDQLVDKLGGPRHVAEMTGRKGRVVQNTKNQILYENRSEADVPLETLNLTEKQRFMDGEKDVAIISEAASSGISLQSDRRVANQKRRVHITLELPWSADRAIQQFGRTHRSNQVNAPEYIFLISDLAGERRFASTVAKRLESLGALTHGDRRATETRDLSQFNIENKHGRKAYRSMVNAIFGAAPALVPPPASYPGDFLSDARAALTDVGITMVDETQNLIPRFLNRLLGVRVTLQNALFQYFSDTFDAIVKEAKRNGRFDLGILDVGASGQEVKRAASTRYTRAHATGLAPVELHTLLVERGLEWEQAVRKASECTDPAEGFYLARHNANADKLNAILCVAHSTARDTRGRNRLFNIYRPNLGLQPQPELLSDILNKYTKISAHQAERPWRHYYQRSLTVCSHAWWHDHCKNIGCEVGTRRRVYYVLSGSVLAAWRALDATYRALRLENRLQVVRARLDRHRKIIGTLIPKYVVELLKQRLKSDSIYVQEQTYDV